MPDELEQSAPDYEAIRCRVLDRHTPVPKLRADVFVLLRRCEVLEGGELLKSIIGKPKDLEKDKAMTDTAKLMIEAGAKAGCDYRDCDWDGFCKMQHCRERFNLKTMAPKQLLAALRALHAAGPSEGMVEAAEPEWKARAAAYWQAMLAQLIAEIGQAE